MARPTFHRQTGGTVVERFVVWFCGLASVAVPSEGFVFINDGRVGDGRATFLLAVDKHTRRRTAEEKAAP